MTHEVRKCSSCSSKRRDQGVAAADVRNSGGTQIPGLEFLRVSGGKGWGGPTSVPNLIHPYDSFAPSPPLPSPVSPASLSPSAHDARDGRDDRDG